MSPVTVEKVTVERVTDELSKLPKEQVAEVYDFVMFLQHRRGASPDQMIDEDEAWLHDDEETMQAEDALWEQTFARQREKFDAMREAARAEIEAGETEPMFDENGKFFLSNLAGIGKELWQTVDVDEYLEHERDSWR